MYRKSSQWFPVAFCWISLFAISVNCLDITSWGGYKGIVAAIEDDVPEDHEVLHQLEKMISASSKLLFQATGKRAYFKDVTVSLPPSWSSEASQSHTNNAHIRVMGDKIGDLGHDGGPMARQIGGCGEHGADIRVSWTYLKKREESRSILPDSEVTFADVRFAQEWAKFRYGIFAEHGIPGNPRYPLFYWRNNRVRPTIGIEGVKGWVQTLEGRKCKMFRGGIVEKDCRFVISAENNITQFALKALPFMRSLREAELWPTDAEMKHDDEAPSPQNSICNHRSSWSVLERSTELSKVTKILKELYPPRTTFKILGNSNATPEFFSITAHEESQSDAHDEIGISSASGIKIKETTFSSGDFEHNQQLLSCMEVAGQGENYDEVVKAINKIIPANSSLAIHNLMGHTVASEEFWKFLDKIKKQYDVIDDNAVTMNREFLENHVPANGFERGCKTIIQQILSDEIRFNPRMGHPIWTLMIKNPHDIMILSKSNPDINVDTWIRTVPAFPSKAFRISAAVKLGRDIILSANVQAHIMKFTEKSGINLIFQGTDTLVLKDNGASGDVAKDDGIYSAYFTNITEGKKHFVIISIEGITGKSKIKSTTETATQPYLFSSDLKVSSNVPASSTFSISDFEYISEDAPEPESDSTQPLLQRFSMLVHCGHFSIMKSSMKDIDLPPTRIRDLSIRNATKKDGNLTISVEWTSTGSYLGREPAAYLELRIAPPTLNLRRYFSCGIEIESFLITEGSLEPLEPGETHQLSFTIPEDWITTQFLRQEHELNTSSLSLDICLRQQRFLTDLADLLSGVQVGIKVGGKDNGTSSLSNVAFFSLQDVSNNIHEMGDALGIDKRITAIVAGVVVGILQVVIIVALIKQFRRKRRQRSDTYNLSSL